MKIAICGKGGSGKSTLTVLLAKVFSNKGYKVLVIDADESNSGLHRKLGFKKAPIPILETVGGRQAIKDKNNRKLLVGGTLVNNNILDNSMIHISDLSEINLARHDNIALVQIGKINQALEGCACPMGMLNREFLDKLILEQDEIAIVDTEAGLEHFGRGMDAAIDSILIIVDPSSESVDFAQRAYILSKSINIKNIWVSLNKIPSNDVAAKLKDKLLKKGISVTLSIPLDQLIFKAELNGKPVNKTVSWENINYFVDIILQSRNEG